MNNPDSDLEKRLWSAADKLRSNMDAAEYKHVVLGLIFLKYVSESFDEVHKERKNDIEHFSDVVSFYEKSLSDIVLVL